MTLFEQKQRHVRKHYPSAIVLHSLHRNHKRMREDCNHDYLNMDLCGRTTRMQTLPWLHKEWLAQRNRWQLRIITMHDNFYKRSRLVIKNRMWQQTCQQVYFSMGKTGVGWCIHMTSHTPPNPPPPGPGPTFVPAIATKFCRGSTAFPLQHHNEATRWLSSG